MCLSTRISSRDALITTSSVLRQLESIAFPRFAGVRPYDAPSSLLSPCSYLILILYPRRGLGRTMQAQRRPQPDVSGRCRAIHYVMPAISRPWCSVRRGCQCKYRACARSFARTVYTLGARLPPIH
jgi:hypothetical protein